MSFQKNHFSSNSISKANSGRGLSGTGPMVQLEDVSVEFGQVRALRSVTMNIDRGEIVFVTGASGAGKTTLLRLISGDLQPDKGRVINSNQSRSGVDFVAEVFQNLRLISECTGLANLNLAYDPTIFQSKKEFNQEMMELARVLGIADRLDIKLQDANGGLKQKIALIRALLTRPSLLVADEPSSSLDYDSTRIIYDILNLYNMKKGLTVVWATHNRELVKKFTGRIVHLDQGRLVYSGHACFI